MARGRVLNVETLLIVILCDLDQARLVIVLAIILAAVEDAVDLLMNHRLLHLLLVGDPFLH